MKRILFVLFINLTFIIGIFSQNTIIFEDNFEDNSNDWSESNTDDYSMKVENGMYYIENKNDKVGRDFFNSKIVLPDGIDFRISVNLIHIDGGNSSSYKVCWGRDLYGNEYSFGINDNGSYIFSKYSNDNWESIINWTETEFTNKYNKNNKLTILKENGYYKFYINDNYVNTYKAEPFLGTKVGFNISNMQKIAVDNLKIEKIVSSDNTIIFEDNFSNNVNEWSEGNTDISYRKIENGKYYLEYKENIGFDFWNNKILLNDNLDFKISLDISHISGVNNSGFGIFWGRDDKGNEFCFEISDNGSYEFIKYYNDHWVSLIEWTKTDFVNKNNSTNKLTVIKQQGYYKFYINDNYVNTYKAEPFFGSKAGFIINNNQKIAIDNYLIESISSTSIVSKGEDVIFEDDFESNSNAWSELNTDDYYRMIENGKYYLENKKDNIGRTFLNNKIVLPDYIDFRLSVDLMHIEGGSSSSYKVCWGRDQNGNEYSFGISDNGSYIFSKLYNDNWVSLINWTSSDFIKKSNSTNKLTIIKQQGYYKFYINDNYVNTYKADPFFGSMVGFYISNKQKIAVDNLKIEKINIKQESVSDNQNFYLNRINYLNDKTKSIQNSDKKESKFISELPPVLSIIKSSFSKGLLAAEEEAFLSVTLKNTGPGDAKDVYISLSGAIQGLSFPAKINVPLISQGGGEQTVTAKFKAGIDIPTTEVSINIEVIEPNFKVKIKGKQLSFNTEEFKKPKLVLPQYEVVEFNPVEINKQINLNEMFNLRFIVQNTGEGIAQNINIEVVNDQKGLLAMGIVDGDKVLPKDAYIDALQVGAYKEITYRYFVNGEFSDQSLKFNIIATEKYNKYGFNDYKEFPINTILEPAGDIVVVPVVKPKDQFKDAVFDDLPDWDNNIDNDKNIPVATVKNKNAIALIIAVNGYTKTYNVKFAKNDAYAIRRYLIKAFGIDQANILPHDVNEPMTFAAMRTYVKDKLPVFLQRDGSSDLYVYYVGHGAKGFKTNSKENVFLIPQDCDPKEANSNNAYPIDDFISDISTLNAKRKFIIIESCYSGQTGDGKYLINNVSGEAEIEINLTAPSNTFIFQSSQANQVSNWYDEKQHSLFTYFFLKSIMQLSKDKKDGLISIADIEAFINNENDGLPWWSKRLFGREQKAVFNGNLNDVFIKF